MFTILCDYHIYILPHIYIYIYGNHTELTPQTKGKLCLAIKL